MARAKKAAIIAVANQKGGVAKTTSVASIGAAMAELGRRVPGLTEPRIRLRAWRQRRT